MPSTTSYRSANDLATKLRETFNRPVLLVTHNIHFLKIQRMTKEESEKVVERITSRVAEEEIALAQIKDSGVKHGPA